MWVRKVIGIVRDRHRIEGLLKILAHCFGVWLFLYLFFVSIRWFHQSVYIHPCLLLGIFISCLIRSDRIAFWIILLVDSLNSLNYEEAIFGLMCRVKLKMQLMASAEQSERCQMSYYVFIYFFCGQLFCLIFNVYWRVTRCFWFFDYGCSLSSSSWESSFIVSVVRWAVSYSIWYAFKLFFNFPNY